VRKNQKNLIKFPISSPEFNKACFLTYSSSRLKVNQYNQVFAATEHDLSKPCNQVWLLPRQSNRFRVIYKDSILNIFCNIKTPCQFFSDGIYKILPNKKETQTLLESSPFIGIRQVFIISSASSSSYLDIDLYKLWKPYCLILVINFPQHVMLQFPK